MKKSKAIKNIINVLRLTGNHYCDNGRDEQDAKRILERIELIGMLPPFVDQYESDTSLDLIGNRWEPEDEEK
jgi:hypothetical protein